VRHQLYLSSFVQRWHTDARLAREGQNLGHHQWGVATLIAALHPNPSRDLLLAALTHDAGEFLTGDLPWMFKTTFPEAGDIVEQVGETARAEMIERALDLTDEDRKWIALADGLEAFLYVALRDPDRLDELEWRAARRLIEGAAWALGVQGAVVGLLKEAV
jgi:5'-deoxynucleotidase YfbR-like HD superfamily hydrolase